MAAFRIKLPVVCWLWVIFYFHDTCSNRCPSYYRQAKNHACVTVVNSFVSFNKVSIKLLLVQHPTSTRGPLSQEFLLHKSSLFLKLGHQSIPRSSVVPVCLSHVGRLKLCSFDLSMCLKFSEVIQCPHPRFQYLFHILAQDQPSLLL